MSWLHTSTSKYNIISINQHGPSNNKKKKIKRPIYILLYKCLHI